MSSGGGGGGGFYKYRCKYFYYTKSCENWVYVNGEACSSCLAEGCDSEEIQNLAGRYYSPDICMPYIYQGVFEYIILAGQQGETAETPVRNIPLPPLCGSIDGAVPPVPRR